MATRETEFERLDIKAGDVLIIRTDERLPMDYLLKIHNRLKDWGKEPAAILTLKHDTDISAIDERQMEAYGWIRKREE